MTCLAHFTPFLSAYFLFLFPFDPLEIKHTELTFSYVNGSKLPHLVKVCNIHYFFNLFVIRAKFAGDLQSVSWMTMALGGICGSLLGGYALNNFEMENIFLLFAVLPMVQLLSCAFVKETPVYSKPSPSLLTSNGSDGPNGSISDEDNSLTHMYKTNSLTRKKSSKQKKKRKTRNNNQMTEKDRSFPSQLLQSLKMAGYTLVKAFRQPIILRYKLMNFLLHYSGFPK